MITKTDLFEVAYDRVFRGQTVDTKRAADCERIWEAAWEAARAQARAELIADIQSAVNHMGVPPGLPPRGAEYFKAGARRAVDAMNSAIDKE